MLEPADTDYDWLRDHTRSLFGPQEWAALAYGQHSVIEPDRDRPDWGTARVGFRWLSRRFGVELASMPDYDTYVGRHRDGDSLADRVKALTPSVIASRIWCEVDGAVYTDDFTRPGPDDLGDRWRQSYQEITPSWPGAFG